ncbi:MAG: VCBS repeat-containing protein [Phycisphaeraceae bacterium]|nr:MAG: VCBS repeat-containing protein [Phycisphaeraceae bacterium]
MRTTRHNTFAFAAGMVSLAAACTIGAGQEAFAWDFAGFEEAESYSVGLHPGMVAMGDINNNGFKDLVVTNTGSNSISVLLNDGAGSFPTRHDFQVQSLPAGVAVADLDGDGNLDIVVANSQSGTVSVLPGMGDGTFGARADLPVGSPTPVTVAIGDVNGDQTPDIVVGAPSAIPESASALIVLPGLGDGTFGDPVVFPVAFPPIEIALADFNGDGWLDIVAAGVATGAAHVLFNNGSGGFEDPVDLDAGASTTSVAAADFYGDGRIDIAVAGADGVFVFRNIGDGSFAPPLTYTAGDHPWRVTVGDVDGDGSPDLVVANLLSHTVSILRNSGVGIFAPAQHLGVEGSPDKVAIGDLTGNGAPDLAISNTGANALEVRTNLSSVTRPRNFSLLTPTDDAAGLPMPGSNNWFGRPAALEWSAAESKFLDVEYSVVIATDPGLMNVVLEANGLAETSFPIPPGALSPNTTYYWGVTASNARGWRRSSPQSSSFTTANPGDLNGSGIVNAQDLAILLSWWGN